MDPIRIVLIDMPRLLRDILGGLASADLHVVRTYPEPVDLVDAVDRDAADVLITGVDAQEPRELERVLVERPSVKVLGIAADGSSTTLLELVPRRRRLGEVSVEQIAAAVRRSVERDREWREAAR